MFLGRYVFTLLILLLVTPLSAQLIGKPELFFDNVCPMEGVDLEYEVAFEVDPSRFNNENTFAVELSDANGAFLADLIEVLVTVTKVGDESLVYAKFKFDKPLYGDSYRIRIESNSPAAISTPSNAFAGYSINNTDLVLNNDEDVELTDTKTEASISVSGNINNRYHWFKDGTFYQETLGTELTVTEPGLYYVSTFYGECTGVDFSNVIKVSKINSSKPERVQLQSVVSPNGDNFNDYWTLPKEYKNKDLRVTLLNQNGTIILDTNTYNNNWPQNNVFPEKGAQNVVYYIIQEKGRLLHKGAITIAN